MPRRMRGAMNAMKDFVKCILARGLESWALDSWALMRMVVFNKVKLVKRTRWELFV
jgi:hypothetical protein